MDIEKRQQQLEERLDKLKEMEKEIKEKEKALKSKESAKKQVLLRLSPSLWTQIAAWADEDFRSINGQIEYLLTTAVEKHFGK